VIVATGIYHPVFFQTVKWSQGKILQLCLLLSLFLPAMAMALSSVKVSIERIDSKTFNLENIDIELKGINSAKASIDARLGEANASDFKAMDVRNLHIHCDELLLDKTNIACNAGTLMISNELLTAKQAAMNWQYIPDKNHLDFNLNNLFLLSGQTRLSGKFNDELLSAQMVIDNARLVTEQISNSGVTLPEGVSLEGFLSGQFFFKRTTEELTVNYQGRIDGLAFSDEAGSYLADSVNADFEGRYHYAGAGHHLERMDLKIASGELLSPFFYTNLSERPLSLYFEKFSMKENELWSLAKMRLQDKALDLGLKDLSGQSASLANGDIVLSRANLEEIYGYYILPVITNDLAQMKTSGELNAKLSFKQGRLNHYDLSLKHGFFIHQPQSNPKKFDIQALEFELSNTETESKANYLSFKKGTLLETIDFGNTAFPLYTGFDSIKLTEPVTMPVFDGDLIIEEFEIANFTSSPSVKFQGLIRPISLSKVTEAFNWPVMTGKISGIIPAVKYRDGNAEFAGTLLVRAFDGNILVKNLKASHLLSAWPVLQADVEFREVDLEKLTETFEFGKITGLLDGGFDQLQLQNWQPTQFDAHFITSEKSSKKRISQRAVDNISNLGGAGVAGALSRSFMRFFDDFGYDRIGFSCQLRDNVCNMSGVEDAESGFYLVKGGGIPRIDVIGHNRHIDWNTLVSRLVNIANSGSPTIQ
jgi:hypothetical protein